MKHRVAIITGGSGHERGISLQSAANIREYVDRSIFDVHSIDMNDGVWTDMDSGQSIDKNDFSLTLDSHKIAFDLVVLMIHGHPAEDGSIQGYFQQLDIPMTGCSTSVSALTFNKYLCNVVLGHFGILSARSLLVRNQSNRTIAAINTLDYPLFVKPNANGSSYGISKVSRPDELQRALTNAFSFNQELIVEEAIHGREFTCGAIRFDDDIIALPVTEIRSFGEYFDYAAKYEQQSDEITPADISDELTAHCQKITRRIYDVLNCRGIIRVDYIMKDRVFYVIEVNTIPGMTRMSLIPQQVRAHGWKMKEFLSRWLLSSRV